MSKIAAIIFVRMGSKRLYGKTLKKIGNKTTLEIIIERIKRASKGIKIIIATSNSYADNKIYLYCKKKKFLCFRGSLDDVFKRTIDCCKKYKLDYFVRVCGDRPFFNYTLLKQMLKFHRITKNKYDILTNVFPSSYPIGLTCELISSKIFSENLRRKINKKEKEHIINYFYRKNKDYKIKNFRSKVTWKPNIKLSLDNYSDFLKIDKIYNKFGYNYLLPVSKLKKYL